MLPPVELWMPGSLAVDPVGEDIEVAVPSKMAGNGRKAVQLLRSPDSLTTAPTAKEIFNASLALVPRKHLRTPRLYRGWLPHPQLHRAGARWPTAGRCCAR